MFGGCIMRFIDHDKHHIRFILKELRLTSPTEAYILHYMLYAIKKSWRAKHFYYLLTLCTVTLPIIATLLQSLKISQNIIPYLTAATSIAAASLSLFKFHEKWTRYRDYVEEGISIIYKNNVAYLKNEQNLSSIKKQEKLETDLIVEFRQLNQRHHAKWTDERTNEQKTSKKV